MSERIKIVVNIFGKDYTVVGEERSSHIREVADIVDKSMREIFKKNPNLDITSLAVLTAVNNVNEYIKVKEELEEMKRKINEK